ncbi:MAG: TonB-dependent receptor plug domain-containing protein [Myxococcota bacterium]
MLSPLHRLRPSGAQARFYVGSTLSAFFSLTPAALQAESALADSASPPSEQESAAPAAQAAPAVVEPRARPARRPNDPPPLTEAIEVTATQAERPVDESPVPVLVLKRTDLERAASLDLAQTLNYSPGVSVSISENSARGGGNGAEIQGLSGKQVLVLLNGRPFVGDSDGIVDLSAFPASALERIEVVTGPMSVLYGGGAIGGVINLFTREAPAGSGGPNMATSFKYSNFNTFETSQALSYGARSMSALLVGSYSSSDGFDLNPDLKDTDGEAYRRGYVFASFTWQVNPQLNVRFDSLFSDSDRARVYLDIPSYELSGDYYFYDWTWAERRMFSTLSAEWTGDKLAIAGWISSSLYHRDYLSQVQGGFKATNRLTDLADLNARLQARWTPSPLFFLMAGMESRWQSLESVAIYTDADDKDTEQQEVAPTSLLTAEAFLLADLLLWQDRLEIFGGLRANFTQNYGFYPPAVLNIKLRPVKPLILRANVGLGYRPPTLKELNYAFDHLAYNYIIRGNPDLVPEYSLTNHLSAELDGQEHGMLRAGYFFNDAINLIDFVYAGTDPDTGLDVFQTANINQAVTQGMEVIGSTRLRDLRFTAAYQLLDARDKATGLPLLRRSRHTAKLNATYAFGDSGIELGSSLRFQGKQYVSDGSDGATQGGLGDGSTCLEPFQEQLLATNGWDNALIDQAVSTCFVESVPFTVVDLRAQARFQIPGRPLTLSFFAGINNLLDVVREPTLLTTDTTSASQGLDIRPMPGRTFFFGVRGDL